MKKMLILLVFLLQISITSCTSKSFQDDADLVRHDHLKYYAGLLKEYYEKTGTYPFLNANNSKQSYVFIANSEQIDDVGLPPYEINEIKLSDFFKELERVLGKSINEYYDPQYEPDNKPNFYMYMTEGDTFYFAIHVSKSYPYAKEIGKGYYKIEISNSKTDQQSLFWDIDEIIKNPIFKEELGKEPSNKNFFDKREEKFKEYSKK